MQESLHHIIKGCIKGDRNSQTTLYELYAPKMLGICIRYCRNREEAEELVQEGFYRVFKYIIQLKNTDVPESWIRKIIINTTVQRYVPKSNLYPILNFQHAGIDITDSLDLYSDLNTKDLIGMIQRLPTSYRLVFNLYVFEGYKHREIGELLNISENTSKSNLAAARASLQRALSLIQKMEIS